MDNLLARLSLLVVLFLGLSSIASASGAARDSVGVQKIGGETFIIHEVETKETLFSISRRYETPVGDIIKNNENLKDGLKIGQRIKVPYTPKAAIPEGATLHKVAPGETLFSVASKYQVSVEDLKRWNSLQGNDLSIGQSLIIQGVKPQAAVPNEAPELRGKPTEVVEGVTIGAATSQTPKTPEKPKVDKKESKPAEKPAAQSPSPSTVSPAAGDARIEEVPQGAEAGWITHTVTKGETLYSISKHYSANMGDLINWNALSSNNLKEGQKLKVGRKEGKVNNPNPAVAVDPVPVTKQEPVDAGAASEAAVKKANTESTAYKNIKESGQAEVIEGTSNHKKYLVLHKTAPVGTIMRVRNEENDITIFARVVGKLPDTGGNKELLIKVSQAAFDQLRAVNNRFRVEISY
ncbi:hypothetical protein GCM10007049_20660 [Echinicola pacifica]|uniref:LysM domain-containing protein n=1 Tax=Echinicola pacifica TaxID=346377 RepID=A0A918UR55_9BACT|nr:LysM peptidoglycan-binding domain-containing protein [Echinicola pacifica]GGZ27680.1 hypothetical protein GCM10007049_20660 [Echinicola pacifica]